MNRAAIAAVLVMLLTVQGSVAGVLTDDAFSNTGNNTTEATVLESVNSTSSAEQSTTEATLTSATAANDETSSSGETTTTTTPTPTETSEPTPTTSTTTLTSTETESETPDATPTESEESDETPTTTESPTETSAPDTPTQPPQTTTDGTAPSTTQAPTGGQSPAGGSAPPSDASGSSTDSSGAGSATPPDGADGSPPAGAEGASPPAGASRAGSTAANAGQPAGAQSGAASGASAIGGAPTAGTAGTAPSSAPSGTAGGAPASGQGSAGAGQAASGSGASPDAEFAVQSVSSNVAVGESGIVTVTIENTGEDATDAVVNLQSLSGDLLFGQSPDTSRFVGDWDEGETKTLDLTMRAARTADAAEYPVQATISYADDDGNQSQSAPISFGVTLDGEQRFTLGGVDSDLAAGEKGTISGTITNEGPKRAADAVLAVSPNGSRDIVPRQSQYVLGDLDGDESESFEYPVFVNGTAEPGQRQMSFVVQYYDSDGNPLQSKPLNAQVDIGAERDDFEITDVDTDVEAGEQGTLSVTMNNTGGNITDTTVSFQSLSGGILFGQAANASRFVEAWDASEQRTFEFDVRAADSTVESNYPMQASLTYDDSNGDQAQAGPIRFGVAPGESRDDFAVTASTADVQVGDEGPVSVTLENTGENVSEATVSLQSLTGDILFGRTANATQFVGEWPAGAERTMTFNATASNNTETRSYPLQTSVSYKDGNGDAGQSGPFTLGITPQPEQSFTLSNTDSTLAVGSEGNVTGTITNQGPQDAQNAVVTLVSKSQNIEPQTTEVALGSLPADGAANFSVPIEVTDGAQPGPQQFSFVVEYDNQNGDTRRSGTLSTQVDIGPQSDEFVVEQSNSTLDIGSSGTVTLNVTNNRDSTVRNVNAKAFVDDPLSLSSDEAYISQLGPGETQQIAFDVSSGGDASAGEYPLSVDFQYDSGGESKLSDTYEVPIELVASDDGGILSSLSVMWGLGAVLVLFGIGLLWSRR